MDIATALKTVTVETSSISRSFAYETPSEASRQFDLWVAQSIHFGRQAGSREKGTYSVKVSQGCHRLHVSHFAHTGIAVYDEVKRAFWTVEEIKAFRTRVPFPQKAKE